jgi:predicted AlkP superfamily phosphohydrolase/phosphomutase
VNEGGVLVIGLDGGTWDVLEPLARRGVMPVLRRVLDEGAHGGLDSVVPWWTVPGWTSLMTGVNPGKHGLIHWFASGASDYWESQRFGRNYAASTDIRQPTLFDIAGAAGKKVAVVNLPVTYPAWPVNGPMVTGLLTPAGDVPAQCHPERLLRDYPEYRVDMRQAIARERENVKAPAPEMLAEITEVTRGRRRLLIDVTKGDRDLVVAVFVGPDRVSHNAWAAQEALVGGDASDETAGLVAEYYRTLDEVLGSLLDAAGDGVTVLFASDHGFGPGPERTFWVNAWMREAGYLGLTASSLQKAAYDSSLRKLGGKVARLMRNRSARPAEYPGVSWRKTSAYTNAFPWCPLFGVWVNAEGVKRNGSIPAADVPNVVRRLEADLADVRDPSTGDPVIRRVFRREEVAEGPEIDRLPDLFVETHPRYYPVDRKLRETRIFQPFETNSGFHVRSGMFAAWGPRANPAHRGRVRIEDLAPTALALLGVEPPDDMDGRVLTDAVDIRGELVSAPSATAPSASPVELSPEDQDAIARHLAELGYED